MKDNVFYRVHNLLLEYALFCNFNFSGVPTRTRKIYKYWNSYTKQRGLRKFVAGDCGKTFPSRSSKVLDLKSIFFISCISNKNSRLLYLNRSLLAIGQGPF